MKQSDGGGKLCVPGMGKVGVVGHRRKRKWGMALVFGRELDENGVSFGRPAGRRVEFWEHVW